MLSLRKWRKEKNPTKTIWRCRFHWFMEPKVLSFRGCSVSFRLAAFSLPQDYKHGRHSGSAHTHSASLVKVRVKQTLKINLLNLLLFYWMISACSTQWWGLKHVEHVGWIINPDVLLWHPSESVRQLCSATGNKTPPTSQRRISGCCEGHRGTPAGRSPAAPSPDGRRPANTPEQPGDPAASRCRHLQKNTSNQWR